MRAARRLRLAALVVLAAGVLISTTALGYQWSLTDGLSWDDLGTLGPVLLVFWSPYVALAALTLWLGRHRWARAAVLFVGAVLVTSWGTYWHLDILVLQPSAVAQVLSPLLIVGSQWLGVIGAAAFSGLAGLLTRGAADSGRAVSRG